MNTYGKTGRERVTVETHISSYFLKECIPSKLVCKDSGADGRRESS